MAYVVQPRVRETSTTTGTGAFTLAGAYDVTHRTFASVCSVSDTFDYFIQHQTLGEWEEGIGTYSGANTLTRTTVKKSSNAGAAVNFSAGTKDVYITHASFIQERLSIAGTQLTGNYTASTLAMATARLLGRTTASSGSAEEISVGTGLTLSGGSLTSSPKITYSTRSSNTILGSSDNGTYIEATSTFTQTFTAAATLGSGWWCYYGNAGTGEITLDPNASEAIDGLTTYKMYPGEVRVIFCTGSAFETVVLQPFSVAFTGTSTFTKPPGYTYFGGLLWGGGGAGGKGNSSTASSSGGGGGGACVDFILPSSSVGTTETITIAGTTTGPSASDTAGSGGGNSTFGSLVTAYGGGGGHALAATVALSGGGGGGALSAGSAGSTTGVIGGRPNAASVGNGSGGGYGGGCGATSTTATTQSAAFGGGGGGGASTSTNVGNGGDSVYGGGGGGGCASGGANVGTGGTSVYGGAGGAGVAASTGGAGTAPGGGGGATRTGTNGGSGARGECRIWGIA